MADMAGGGWDYDVAVIGGGPGGSSAATTLARLGRRVILLEREQFPRFHIGESLLPWNNEVFQALGVQDSIAAAGFVPKWGATFRPADRPTEQYADFSVALETPTPQTYQVLRQTFDDVLLKHSAKCGVNVLESHRVLDVAFAPDAVTVRFADAESAERSVRVATVVDASGRAGLVVKRFGRHEVDPLLRNISVHAQYEGIPRAEGRRAGDIRMFTRPDMGWLWLIPVSETVISVGAVIPKAVHLKEARPTADDSLEHYLDDTPAAGPLLANKRRVSPARYDADYSYLATRMAGDRWVAVGDAAAFLDPIFSTGVLLAMQGGIEAGQAIDAGLRSGDLSAKRFVQYERVVRKRYHHFRRFAVGFYDQAFRELWFVRPRGVNPYRAIVSVLAGNWRPKLLTRLKIESFFMVVALRRRAIRRQQRSASAT